MKIQIGSYKLEVGIAIAVLIVVLAGVAWWAFYMGKNSETNLSSETLDNSPTSTRSDVSADIPVPEPGDENFAENIAKPSQVRKTSSATAKDRDFSVDIAGDAFMPDTVIIAQGDGGWISFTAVDGAYDVYQPDKGLSISLEQGETKVMAAHFSTPGEYTMFCRSCGGPDEGPIGYIVVVPEE